MIFPLLREVRSYESTSSELLELLTSTVAFDNAAPRSLTIHHDFETAKEAHLLRLSATAFGKQVEKRGPFVADMTASSRPFLDLYIGRRITFAFFIERLLVVGLPQVCIDNGMRSVEVWLKSGHEMSRELDAIMRRQEWRPYVIWDASEYELSFSTCTSSSALTSST